MRKTTLKNKSRCVVSGATSMLGVALVQECLGRGERVAALVRPGSPHVSNLPSHPSLEIVACGLGEMRRLPALLKGTCGVFYHLGWSHTDKTGRNDPMLQSANISHTLEAVEAAAQLGCKVFLGAGSQAEYGSAGGVLGENTPAAPEFAYATAKYAAGKLSAIQCQARGLKHVWTRIFSVYGPFNRPDNMILYCVDAFLKRQKPAMTGCGQVWDYLYCADAARAIQLAAEKGKDQGVYNIGSGQARPLKEYVTAIRDSVNPKLEIGFNERPYPPGQIMHLSADISRLKQDTGFKPVVSFEEGIKKTIQWYKGVIKK